MTPLPKSTFGMNLKVIVLNFKQKQVKKWDQNVSRSNFFFYL